MNSIARQILDLCEAMSFEEYIQGFKSLDLYKEDSSVASSIDYFVRHAMEILKKNSRITWFLRLLKIYEVLDVLEYEPDKLTDNDRKRLERELRKYEEVGVSRSDLRHEFVEVAMSDVATMLYHLEHFFSDTMVRNIPEIGNYEPGMKTFTQAIQELRSIEEKHMAKAPEKELDYEPHRYVSISEAEEKEHWEVLPMRIESVGGGNLEWWLIPNYTSKLIKRAMSDEKGIGHCGTCQNHSSQLLILAEAFENSGDPSLVPHLSFELGPDGELLQMKGYKNSKPQPKYLPAIVKLLSEFKLIKEVRGGNYRPETDFKMSDLSDEQRLEVMEKNRSLADPVWLAKREKFTGTKSFKQEGKRVKAWFEDGDIVRKIEGSWETWYKNGKLSREDGPARIQYSDVKNSDGSRQAFKAEWIIDGAPHRKDGGPTNVTYYTGGSKEYPYREEWRSGGTLHREDGPAFIQYRTDSTKHIEAWFLHGIEARKDKGPIRVEYRPDGSIIKQNFSQRW